MTTENERKRSRQAFQMMMSKARRKRRDQNAERLIQLLKMRMSKM